MKKNLLAALVGIFIVLFLFAAAEIIFRLKGTSSVINTGVSYYHEKIENDKSWNILLTPEFEKELRENPFQNWKSLLSRDDAKGISYGDLVRQGTSICCINSGYVLPEGKYPQQAVSKKTGQLIYDITLTVDKHYRRVTPIAPRAEEAILMYGDSYTLGEAVEDNQTAPYILGQLRPNAQVYNMGISGGSPNYFLYEVSQIPGLRTADIGQKKVTVIYTFMSDHLERLFCRSLCMADSRFWVWKQPYYKNIGGRPYFAGTFMDREDLNSFYKMVEGSAFLRSMKVVIPPYFSERHFEFFVSVIDEARDYILKKYPGSDFYVAFYPGDSHPFGNILAQACEAKGIKVLNYTNINTYELTKMRERVPGDGHPSPLAHYIFAKLLDRDLPK